MTAEILELARDRLYALVHPYALDGRVSSHPKGTIGYAPLNVYLLREGREALMVDTGFTVHCKAIVAQLEALLEPDTKLAVWSLRIGEYNSISNLAAIAEKFSISKLYAAVSAPATWARLMPLSADCDDPLAAIPAELTRPGGTISVDTTGRRLVTVLPAPLRLLPTVWAYDRATATLFTSDAFSYAWRETSSESWSVEAVEDYALASTRLAQYVNGGRLWWLPEANRRKLGREVLEVFNRVEVHTIAPAFGCLLRGRQVVEHCVGQTLDVIGSSGRADRRRFPL